MKKISLILLGALLIFSFTACSDSSDDDDNLSYSEDYSGVWYEYDSGESEYEKSDMSDTTWEVSVSSSGSYKSLFKGTLEKKSGSTVDVKLTHYYLTTENTEGSLTVATEDEGWYDKSEMLEYGISNGHWGNETEMIDALPFSYDTVTTNTYVLSADKTTLTMTDTDGSQELYNSEALALANSL